MVNRIHRPAVPVILLLLLLFQCGCGPAEKRPMKIAVTKASKNYVNWLLKGDSALVTVEMLPMSPDSAVAELFSCSGLLVTGGEDVQPEYYGKGGERSLCTDTDPRRDTLEIALIRRAVELGMPVLGICRGEQILNVALGGTLIVDIPAHFEGLPRISVITHKCNDYLQCYHPVTVFRGTLLDSIVRADTGMVTSNHHQAVEQLAQGLAANARSADGITEGIEYENPFEMPFLLGVQWHPERMDTANDLSGKVLEAFLKASNSYMNKKN